MTAPPEWMTHSVAITPDRPGRELRLGVVSDTHGLVRGEVREQLDGSDAIIHAGDVGGPQVLEELGRIAPVHAVRGNVDLPAYLAASRRRGRVDPGWAELLPDRLDIAVGDLRIVVVHAIADLDDWSSDVVVVGHSHVPVVERRGSTLVVNPGSAGPRRFRLPISLGSLVIADGTVTAHLTDLGS